MYLLKVKKYSSVKVVFIQSEQEALRRMRLWAKHPECISAEVIELHPQVYQNKIAYIGRENRV